MNYNSRPTEIRFILPVLGCGEQPSITLINADGGVAIYNSGASSFTVS